MLVKKSNGTFEEFDMNKIVAIYNRITEDLDREKYSFEHLEQNIKTYVVDGISTVDLNKMIIKSAKDLISISASDWTLIAGRFTTLNLYKLWSKSTGLDIDTKYDSKYFLQLVETMVADGYYHKDLLEKYTVEDLIKAGEYIDKERDMIYNEVTMNIYIKRYLLNINGIIRELPQHMYMAIGLFLAMPEKEEDRLEFAFKIYEACSKGEISLPTPTLLNARQPNCQLSSCFKLSLDDDLRGIYHGIENMAQISKFGGGIGVYLGNIRAKGGSIRGRKGASSGLLPFAKVINDTAIAVNQLAARIGAISVTLDVWHLDIFDFLDMQTETGDLRKKSFDLFPAVSFPDLFMKRVDNNESFTLFCPKEVEDITGKRLQDFYGEEFEKFYLECEKNPKLELKEVVPAKDIFVKYLKATVETGMPYAFFRDTANKMNPNKHSGMIYHSNLCCVTADTKVLTDVGDIIIGDNVGKKVNVWNGEEFSEVEIVNTRKNEKILRIELESGKYLDCTYYHTFYLVGKEGDIITARADELSINDTLIPYFTPDKELVNFEEIKSITRLEERQDTFCFDEPKRHMGVFNGILTGQCEIMQNSSSTKFIEETIDGNKVQISYEAGDTVVCNLASINVAKVNKLEDMRRITDIVTRILDNVITLNFYPVKEAELTSNKYRPIGIGYLGLAEYFAVNKIGYTSEEAKIIAEDMFKTFSYLTLKASNKLAKERGAYELFKGSEWSKGKAFGQDIVSLYDNEDGIELTKDILEYGLRFGYHFSPAPNTSSALVIGTTASLLPIYKKFFIETNGVNSNIQVAPNITEDNMWFYQEYVNADLNKVIDLISIIQKYIDQSISFEFFVDSKNTSPKDLYNYYFKSWRQGIKTIYYVRSTSGTVENECVSCSG